MNKIRILIILLTFALGAEAQTPNILLIIADDLGTDALNGFTNQSTLPSTPTLDSLRANGIAFTNAWAAPKCTPTRASIMSGMHGSKTGVLGTPGNLDLTYTSVLNTLDTETNDAYAKAVIGKWHISQPVDVMHPYDHGADYYMGFMQAFPTEYSAWDKTENNVTAIDSTYVTTTITDRAITWTGQQTKPWLLWLAHAAPHTPYHVPPSHMYTINNPDNNNTRRFLAMIESVDYEINRLLNSMSTTEKENTLIIFIGDNGTGGSVLRDYPNGHGKSTIYEGGIRVPMIVCGKGVTRKGVVETALINVADIHATILDVTGSALEGGLNNSLSFKHLLTGDVGISRDYNFSEINEGGDYSWAIRNEQYKLIEFEDGSQEFYDLLTDQFEFSPIDITSLTTELVAIKLDLETEAETRRTSWSCRDHIKNGDEEGIDCGGSNCAPCIMSTENILKTNIKVFPNPSSGSFLVTSDAVIQTIQIFTLQGRLIQSIDDINSTSFQIDGLLNASSIAILEVQTASGIVRKRVMKY
jgi:arylsulfatase A-like enzyme